MHVKDYRAHQFTDLVTQYINQCRAFASEFHLDEFQSRSMTDIGVMPDGQKISQLIPAKKFAKLEKILLKAFGIHLAQLDHIYPLFIINLLSEKVMINSEGIPLDTVLWQTAAQRNRIMLGLESIQDQFDIMNSLSMEYQIKALKDVGANTSRFRKNILKLISAYEEQNIKQLYLQSKKSLANQKRILLYRRNRIMTGVMLSAMSDHNTVFSAIGAAHLWGAEGMLTLLKYAGCSVKPVRITQEDV